MKAVILAAGKGTRMPEITAKRPKCLIEIGKTTILDRQIKLLSKHLIKKIYVVIGYKSNQVKTKIDEKKNVEMIYNKEYATTDNIYSLYLTRDKVKGFEFLLLNGDVLFEKKILKKLNLEKESDIVPVDSRYYDLESLKIKEKRGMAVEILPKTASKKESNGSTIGMFKFSSKASTILFEEIEKIVKNGITDKWFEFALNKIFSKTKMNVVDIKGLKWIEVDTYNDVKKAQELFSR